MVKISSQHEGGRGLTALVIGYGSIGRRHVVNLAAEPRIGKILVSSLHCHGGHADGKVEFLSSPCDLPLDSVDLAVIASDTSDHLATAEILAKQRIPLLVEKPVAESATDAERLLHAGHESVKKILVGYNMRFLPVFQYIREKLPHIGTPLFARIEAGYYLPLWRPHRDYRSTYSARPARGGGVSLDLSHEVDYMRLCFGMPSKWKTFRCRTGTLCSDCDDVFEGIYSYGDGFVCSVHLDYLELQKRRFIRIVGSKGTLTADFVAKEVRVAAEDGSETAEGDSLFDMDRSYVDELRHFIDMAVAGVDPAVTVEDGIAALRLLEDGADA